MQQTCQSVISIYMQRTTSKTWTRTLDPDPDKPGRLKTWTQKKRGP